MNSAIDEAIKVFKQGGIVIFPTDTVWGIGCRLDNSSSVQKLFEIRRRPENKAVIALVEDLNMAQEYVNISNEVKESILQKYWPQSLTVILPCKEEKVPPLARGGGNTLAVRIPNHPSLLPIISSLTVPILAPSANFAGEPTPKRLSEIDKELLSLVDYVLEGESLGALPSTILDCSNMPWKIIRQGELRVEL